MIVWTDYSGIEHTLEQLIEAATFAAEGIIDDYLMEREDNGTDTNPNLTDFLDFAHHTFRVGCSAPDAWKAYYELDPVNADKIATEHFIKHFTNFESDNLDFAMNPDKALHAFIDHIDDQELKQALRTIAKKLDALSAYVDCDSATWNIVEIKHKSLCVAISLIKCD